MKIRSFERTLCSLAHRILLGAVLVGSILSPTHATPTADNQADIPKSLMAAFQQARHAIEPSVATAGKKKNTPAFQANNPGHRLHVRFSEKGFEVTPSSHPVNKAPWHWRMSLTSYGNMGALQDITDPILSTDGNRITYQRSDVDEWYINDSRGVEQGFTLKRTPANANSEVILGFDLDTNLKASWVSPGQDIAFKDKIGSSVFNYNGLKAWDANHKPVAAQLALAENDSSLLIRLDTRDAVYPITIDPLVSSEDKLIAKDAEAINRFGSSVSLSGKTALIGAYQDNCAAGPLCGSVYVFTRSGSSWTEQQKLTASDADRNALFGSSIALSGDTAVIGAWGGTAIHNQGGSAYVFTRSGSSWTEQQKLTASDTEHDDQFGRSVSLSGDTALISAHQNINTCPAGTCGAAYVFTRTDTTWTEQQKLTTNDASENVTFGVPVALSGDTALVGGSGGSSVDCSAGICGAAYIFTRSGTTWSEQQKLTSSDGTPYNNFGQTIALSGDTALIGAHQNDCTAGFYCGAVYAFTRSGSAWSEQQKLTASDPAQFDFFGHSIALYAEEIALIGAHGDDCAAGDYCGAAYVFTNNGSAWNEQLKLTASDADANDRFGYKPIALSANTAMVGAEDDSCTDGDNCGAVYAYTFNCGIKDKALQANRWTMIGLSCKPDAPGTVESVYGDDLNTGDYGSRWVVYKWNAVTNSYTKLGLGNALSQGNGHWVLSLDAANLDISGDATDVMVSAECAVPEGCYEIPLTPPDVSDTEKVNLIGYPFTGTLAWEDVRIRSGGSVYTPSTAHSAGIMNKTIWFYNGNGYDMYDDVTAGMEGELQSFDGFWVKTLPNAAADTTLLLPSTP